MDQINYEHFLKNSNLSSESNSNQSNHSDSVSQTFSNIENDNVCEFLQLFNMDHSLMFSCSKDFDKYLNKMYNYVSVNERMELSCFPFVVNQHDHSINDFLNILELWMSICVNLRAYNTNTGITNLSSHILSVAETAVLENGLNFCPTPKPADIGDFNLEVQHFFRNVKLKLFFEDSHEIVTNNTTHGVYQTDRPRLTRGSSTLIDLHNQALPTPSITHDTDTIPFGHPDLKLPSRFNPPSPSHLDHVLNLMQNEILNSNITRIRDSNMVANQYRAITCLRTNPNIVIKPADKGSGIVIMNTSDYIKEGLRQLNDQSFYLQTDGDLTPDHVNVISKYVQEMFDKGEISKDTRKFLLHDCNRTAQFYLLPKIHKDRTNPPGRPIVSGNGCPTEKISQLVDIIIKPLVPKIQSYIKDTNDFITKLHNLDTLPEGTLLVTLDVRSLYTSIPHSEGIKAVSEYLSIYRDPNELPSNKSIIELLEKVLTLNNFDFNGNHYLQVSGTAMGTRLAPSYANIYMARFEEKHVYTYPNQPLLWLRYIDDVFMLWIWGREKLSQFVDFLNSCEESIEFTCEASPLSVPFLDVSVYITPLNTIATSLYCKPTDTHSYLMFNSDHPPHTKTAIPYSQFLRVRRICTSWFDFFYHSLVLLGHFLRRKYPMDLLLDSLLRASKIDRDILIQKPLNSNTTSPQSHGGLGLASPAASLDKRIFFVHTHNRSNPPVRQIINTYWPYLGRSISTRPLLDYQIVYSLKRSPNLRDLLVRAKLPGSNGDKQRPHCLTAHWKNPCKYCPMLNTTGQFIHPQTGKSFVSMKNICCKSNNLIYCLECNVCHILYIGQTSNAIMTRVSQHLRDIKKQNPSSTVARHYNGHQTTPDPVMRVTILEFIRVSPKTTQAWDLRLKREKAWITRLNTLIPSGLNLLE